MKRRDFIKHLALGSVAMSVYTPLENFSQASGTRKKRRHLINIIKGGGWDAFWHHSSFAPSQLRFDSNSPLSVADGTSQPGGLVDSTGGSNGGYSSYTQREPESAGMFYSSQGRDHYFGSSFKALFQNQSFQNHNPLLSKMQIWKGISSGCRHELDNPIILHGVSSSYARSFSALVSARLAQDSVRTLHYTVLHNNPSDAFLNFALNTGYQTPSCIPGVSGIQSLTGTDPNDFNSVSRRNVVSNLIKNLSGSILQNRLKLRSSISSLSQFSNSFSASEKVSGSHLDEDVELLFARLRFRYASYTQMSQYFAQSHFGPIIANYAYAPDFINNMNQCKNVVQSVYPSILSQMNAYRLQDASTRSDAALKSSLTSALQNGSMSAFADVIDQFALAAYLVRQNLSAVVDFRFGHGSDVVDDAHFHCLEGVYREIVNFSCYAELLLYLDEVKEVNPGESLLDATHVVMHTEMDRSPYVGNHKILYGNGTDHSVSSTSAVMAGYGVEGGKVIGDLHKGTADLGMFPGTVRQFTNALPIDVNSGLPSSSGKLVSIKSIAPTILAMFDVPVPFDQISDEGAVPAAFRVNMG